MSNYSLKTAMISGYRLCDFTSESYPCTYCPYFYNTGEANYCVISCGLDELDEFVPLRE